MKRLKKKSEFSVALQCQECGEINNYEVSLFKSWLRKYKKYGSIPQSCCNGNTEHKIIGYFEDRQIPMKDLSVIRKFYRGKR